MEGYIKLHRQLMENKLWCIKPFSKGQAWVELLMMANHSDADIMFGNQNIHIERGSFITSILKLSERWGWSRHKVKEFLSSLESLLMLVLKTDNKKSLINIVNYSLYQGSENEKDIAKDIKRTSKGHQKDTNKNDKNDNNDNNLDNTNVLSCDTSKYTHENTYYKLAVKLSETIHDEKVNPTAIKQTEPNLQSWANTFRLMVEKDKRNPNDIYHVFKYALYGDPFWRTNMLSAEAVRKHYDRVYPLMIKDRSG